MSGTASAAFVWSIADLLRRNYKQSDYGGVILPFTLLRRLDCTLAPTKEAVLREHAAHKELGAGAGFFLTAASGFNVYNTSPLDLGKLLGDPNNLRANLTSYIGAFSENTRDIFERYEFEQQVEKVLSGSVVGLAGGRVCDTRRMNEQDARPCYKRHRFPAEIIGHAVWLYFRFALSYRDVEELLAERGVVVTYETVRQWCRKFGQSYANERRRRRPRPGDKWHLDEVFITSKGTTHDLWRAVDQDGNVLDILVPARRDKAAAAKFLRKVLRGRAYVPRVVITDKFASYGAARRAVLPSVAHRRHKGRNNRAERAHQPTRERERRLRRFKDPGHAPRFLAASGPIAGHCRPRRHRLTATAYRETRTARFATWRAVTGTPAMA